MRSLTRRFLDRWPDRSVRVEQTHVRYAFSDRVLVRYTASVQPGFGEEPCSMAEGKTAEEAIEQLLKLVATPPAAHDLDLAPDWADVAELEPA